MPRLYFLLILTLLLPPVATAASMDAEIAYLLQALDDDSCTYIRNDISYTSREFQEQLQSKLRLNDEQVNSTEDFIEKIATRSAVSEIPYVALCDGELRVIKEWLTTLLASYRRSN